jgi:hypothetical protein
VSGRLEETHLVVLAKTGRQDQLFASEMSVRTEVRDHPACSVLRLRY